MLTRASAYVRENDSVCVCVCVCVCELVDEAKGAKTGTQTGKHKHIATEDRRQDTAHISHINISKSTGNYKVRTEEQEETWTTTNKHRKFKPRRYH